MRNDLLISLFYSVLEYLSDVPPGLRASLAAGPTLALPAVGEAAVLALVGRHPGVDPRPAVQ